jgi:hypothetical protein
MKPAYQVFSDSFLDTQIPVIINPTSTEEMIIILPCMPERMYRNAARQDKMTDTSSNPVTLACDIPRFVILW